MAKLLDHLGKDVLGSDIWMKDKKSGYENDVIMPAFNEYSKGNIEESKKAIGKITNCDVFKTPQFVNRDNPEIIKLFNEHYDDLTVIVMYRDFKSVAKSFINHKIIPGVDSKHSRLFEKSEVGGLEKIVEKRYNNFIKVLDDEEIKYKHINYTKMINEEEYALVKLSEIFPNMESDKIKKVYNEITIKK